MSKFNCKINRSTASNFRLYLVFVIFTMTALFNLSCSEHIEPSEEKNSGLTHTDSEIKNLFFQKAKAGKWSIVGSNVFQKIDKGFSKTVIPQYSFASSTQTRLISSHPFKNLTIATDNNSILALSRSYQGLSKEDSHLIIFDKFLNTLYEDKSISFIGNKGPNTLSGLRWSKNQKYIAFAQNKNIWILDLENQQRQSIAANHQRDLAFSAPSWSADSRHLVYENDLKQVVIINIETKTKEVVASGRFPQWSPDGKHLVYRKDNGQTIIYSVALKSEVDSFKLISHHPDYLWSPDSQYILLAQKIHNSYKSDYFIYSIFDQKLLNLNYQYGKLKNHFIQPLPEWLESRLIKLVEP